jgi:hypothetical protein
MRIEFEKAGFVFPRDYAVVWDATMARFWFPGGDAIREHICDWLRERREGRILTREEMGEWGCSFPGNLYGEVFFLLRNGTIFTPSIMKRGGVAAMHGYDPREPESRACWLTTHVCDHTPSQIHEINQVMRAAVERISAEYALV